MQTDVTDSRSRRFFRAIWSILSVLLALVALVLFLAWMGGAFHEKVPPGVVPVERATAEGRTLVLAERAPFTDTISAVGTVQPRRKTDVASQLLSTIREIKPRSGDKVKIGDTLVSLDDREILAQQREAVAMLATAEADVVTRKDDYERIKALRKTGGVSAEEMNRVEGAFRVAETQVKRAKETISRIEVLITYTKIVATSEGIVADRLAEPGDIATPGKTLITFYDPNDLELHANVPESLASGVIVGQKLQLRIDAQNLEVPATVREIVPQAQQASRSVVVKLQLPVLSSQCR